MKLPLTLWLILAPCAVVATEPPVPPAAQPKTEEKALGKIYEPNLSPDKPLFHYEFVNTQTGNKTQARTLYTSPDGTPVVEEETQTEDGKLKSYLYHQRQVDESGNIEVRDGKVHFTFVGDGKTQTETEDFDPKMIVPDMLRSRIIENWAQLESGDDVLIRLLLIERQESVGFKFFKEKDVEKSGVPAVELILKPSSFLIAAIAPSIKVYVEKAPPHRILETFGRLPVRVLQTEKHTTKQRYKAIDGRMTLEYPAPAPPPKPEPEKPVKKKRHYKRPKG